MQNPTFINLELVAKITLLVEEWNAADRQLRELFTGWQRLATRAGLERGFYTALGNLPGTECMCEPNAESAFDAGQQVYAAYIRGGLAANLDTVK